VIATHKNAVWPLCKAGVGEGCTAESAAGCLLNGSLVNRPCEDSVSVSIFFQSCWHFTPFPSPVDVFAHRQGDSCLYRTLQPAAVDLQGLADQANSENSEAFLA